MNHRRLIGAAIAALAISSAGTASAQSASIDALQAQVQLINQLADKFQSDAAAQYGAAFNAGEWKRDFGARMLYQSPQALSAALGASDFASAQAALASAAGKPQPKHTADDNLALNAITPCRVADTRGAVAGIMPGSVWRDFSVLAPPATIAAQGGAAAGCPLPTGVQGFVLLVSVVPTGVFGGSTPNFLTVQHSSLVGPPSTASMTYYPGAIDSALAIALCNGSCPTTASGSVAVYTSGSTHVIIDWVGWLGSIPDEPAVALTCTYPYNAVSTAVAAGGTACVDPPACPAGYSQTGALFDNVSFGGLVMAQLNANVAAGTAMCGYNTSASSKSFFAGSVCCRVPAHSH